MSGSYHIKCISSLAKISSRRLAIMSKAPRNLLSRDKEPSPVVSNVQELPEYSFDKLYPSRRIAYCSGWPSSSNLSILDQFKSSRVLGFDIEWKPNFVAKRPENKVALVQVANENLVVLVHVSSMNGFPPGLRRLLNDRNILKVGVAIAGDAEKLMRDWNVQVNGVLDLGAFARQVDAGFWSQSSQKNTIGLARLVSKYLAMKLNKPRTVTRSNWENHLTPRQQLYAANDASSGYDIYEKLQALGGSSTTPSQRVNNEL